VKAVVFEILASRHHAIAEVVGVVAEVAEVAVVAVVAVVVVVVVVVVAAAVAAAVAPDGMTQAYETPPMVTALVPNL
jgi:hypothetical protein